MMALLLVHVRRTAFILITATFWLTLVHAQEITAEQYAADCRAYVADGNEIAARGACHGALQLDPTFDEAGRLLAQLDIRAGNLAAAQARLEAMQSARPHSDTLVLLAGIAVINRQPLLVEQYLQRIERLAPPSDMNAVPFLQVQLHLLRGEYTNAVHDMLHSLPLHGNATDEIILTEIVFLTRLREFTAAAEHLEFLPTPTATRAAQHFELLAARLAWATGDLDTAQGHYEAAFAIPGTDVHTEAYTAEHEYALVLLGQGQFAEAYRAWLAADSRAHGRWWLQPVSVSWVAIIMLFIALTMVAEASIPPTAGRYAPTNRQVLWSTGGSFAIAAVSLIVAVVGVLITSLVSYGSWIALLAPPNVFLLRMLFVTYVLLSAGAIAFVTLQRYTKSALHELLGPRIHWSGVFWGGIVFAAFVFGWEFFVVLRFRMMDIPFEMFAPLPVIVLFAVALVLGEVFFRAFVVPTFQLRYSNAMSIALAAVLYGIVLGAPVILFTAIGAFFSWLYTRNRSGLSLALAMAFGLVLLFTLTAIMPQLRTLFF